MNKLKSLVTIFSTAIILIFAIESNASAQMLLNEVEADPPSEISEGCQYVELRGTPGSTVPNGIWFLSVDGGAGNFGNVSSPVNLSGMQFGSNGTITIASTSFNECLGRTFPSGTTLVDSQSFFGFGIDTESYLVISAPVAMVFSEGDDIDQNNDRVIDPAFSITVIDGFATIVNITAQAAYAPIVFQGDVNQPDAFTRFPVNNTPLSAAAWYYGELAASPDSTTTYAAPLSPNFPTGGALSPGAPNSGPTAAAVTVGGRITTSTGRGISRVRLTLTGPKGDAHFAMTNTFGFYRFTNILPGETYTISGDHKRYTFPIQVINVAGEINDLDFVLLAQP